MQFKYTKPCNLSTQKSCNLRTCGTLYTVHQEHALKSDPPRSVWKYYRPARQVDMRVVARSAQKAKGATVGHRVSSPSHALKMELRIVRCCRSTMPFAWELYADMRMCRMPNLSVSQLSAASCAVVSDDLLYCSPPAEDLLEYEQAD